jgi:hypothetical protein
VYASVLYGVSLYRKIYTVYKARVFICIQDLMREESGSGQSGLVISRAVSKRVVTSAAPSNLRVPARNLARAGEVTCPTHPTMTKSARVHPDSHQVTTM